jgi:putative Holliday junction resolvase
MAHSTSLLALDVGEKRIGVALADSAVRIAIAYDTIDVDGTEIEQVARLIGFENVDIVVIGYPRNQSGEPTKQTEYVEKFAGQLNDIAPAIVYQDESLTSVQAEERLKASGKPYAKGDIDALAASLILQDYLEQTYGRV